MNKKFLSTLLILATNLIVANAQDNTLAKEEHGHTHDTHATCNHEHEHAHSHETCNHEHDESCNHSQTCGHEHQEGHEHEHSEHSQHEHEAHSHENCSHEHAHDTASNAHADHNFIPVVISDKARESIALHFEKISNVPAIHVSSYYGRIAVPAKATKTAALPVAGRVKFFVNIGEDVKKGQTLFSLSSPLLITLQSDVREARAAIERAKSELSVLQERLDKLTAAQIKSSELEASVKFKKAEIANLSIAAKRSVELWRQATQGGEFRNGELFINSRYSGNIQSLDLNEGAWGEQGAPALTYIAKGFLEFKGEIRGNEALKGKSARLALTHNKHTEYFSGTLRASTQINETTQTRSVYFQPDSLPETAFAGQIARLEIFTPENLKHGYVPVPNSAIIKVGVDSIVFVCVPENPNKFIAVKVQTLPSRHGKTPAKGLPANATIVTKGGYELKYILPAANGAQKKAAGHFHADGKFHEGEH